MTDTETALLVDSLREEVRGLRASLALAKEALERVLDCLAERKLEICIDCIKLASASLGQSNAVGEK